MRGDLCAKPASLCLNAGVPHRHCACLLPIGPDAHWCSMCLAEMLRRRGRFMPAPVPRRRWPRPVHVFNWGGWMVEEA